jgi:isopentenyl diphosphate isomerase/L-lactate dehydrogenase-like FMN-dependent dehydrogenase
MIVDDGNRLYPDIKTLTCVVRMQMDAAQAHADRPGAGDDIPWIQSLTKLPLVIKGIQCVEVLDRSPLDLAAF